MHKFNKEMKKYLNFMTFVMMAVFSLTFVSCGDDDEDPANPLSEYVGTWAVSVGNDEEDEEALVEYVQFKSDGSFIDVREDEESEKGYTVLHGKWSVSGDKITLMPYAGMEVGFTLTYDIVSKEKDKIVFSNKDMTFVFIRVDDSVIEKYL